MAATSKDRRQISELYAAPLNLRDASSQPDPWKGIKPTPILVPNNNARFSSMAKTPDAKRSDRSRGIPSHARQSFGNQTASKTLTGRPSKRQKTSEHSSAPPGLNFSSVIEIPQPKTKSDPIVLDDDEEEERITFVPREVDDEALSDDLNLHSGPSSSHLPSRHSGSTKQEPTPDGPTTARMQKVMQESDPISDWKEGSFIESNLPPGWVKEQTRKINFLSQPLKTKMKKKFNIKPADDIFQCEDTLSKPAGLTSSAMRQKEDGYSLSECYLDAVHYSNQQNLRMQISKDGILSIEGDDKVYAKATLSDLEIQYPNPPHSKQDVLLIKHRIQPKKGPHIITLRLVVDSFPVNLFMQAMRSAQKLGARVSTHLSSPQIWETALNHARSLLEEQEIQEDDKPMSRTAELQALLKRKNHNLSRPPPSGQTAHPSKRKAEDSLRYTPPDGSEVREEDKKKTIKKPNMRAIANTATPTRSSKRQASAKQKEAGVKPVKDLKNDELILSYPQGQPGAVNITIGDKNRLQPGEFLNDTLIEFGLRYWLNQLERQNPDLASQVHIFNSFFFKKFNQKDLSVGYQSVRKWTSKIDIFQKKFIIVPINEHLHWYLIIIHEPEHILTTQAPPPTPPSRPNTRSAAAEIEQIFQTSTEGTTPSDSPATPLSAQDRQSETEVENHLSDFQSSCNIIDGYDSKMGSPPRDVLYDITWKHSTMPSDDPDMMYENLTDQPSESTAILLDEEEVHEQAPEVVIIDDEGDPIASTSAGLGHSEPTDDSSSATSANGIHPEVFYSKKPSRKGKEKAVETQPETFPMDVDSKEDEEVEIVSDKLGTQIISFDSLGSKHPTVLKKLAQYLQMEAKDKKGIENAGVAPGIAAPVPCQDNFCDCGLFLLHFAETFVSDAKRYRNIINSKRSKSHSNRERGEIWHIQSVQEDRGREKLDTAISDLSTAWKRERTQTKEKTTVQEEKEKEEIAASDDEVEVIDVQGAKKSKPKTRIGPASKMRG